MSKAPTIAVAFTVLTATVTLPACQSDKFSAVAFVPLSDGASRRTSSLHLDPLPLPATYVGSHVDAAFWSFETTSGRVQSLRRSSILPGLQMAKKGGKPEDSSPDDGGSEDSARGKGRIARVGKFIGGVVPKIGGDGGSKRKTGPVEAKGDDEDGAARGNAVSRFVANRFSRGDGGEGNEMRKKAREDKKRRKQQKKNDAKKKKEKQEKGVNLDPGVFVGPRLTFTGELGLLKALEEEEGRGSITEPSSEENVLEEAWSSIESNWKGVKETVSGVRPDSSEIDTEAERIRLIRETIELQRRRKQAEKAQQKKEIDDAKRRENEEKSERMKAEAAKQGEKSKKTERSKIQANVTVATGENGKGRGDSSMSGGLRNATNAASEGGGGGPIAGAQGLLSNAWESVFKKERRTNKEEWVVVCPKRIVAPGMVVPVVANGLDLLIVALNDGKTVRCVANECPHLGTPLETGTVERRPKKYDGISSRGGKGGGGNNGTAKDASAGGAGEEGDDGCETCIVCPLHRTAFSLDSGEVRGEWCPYPPVIGKVMGTVKTEANLPTFEIRTRGKNIEVRLNSSLDLDDEDERKKKKSREGD